MAVVEGFTYGGGIGFAGAGMDVLPEIHQVAELLVRAGRDVRMDGDDRCAVFCEEARDRDLALEPFRALPRAVEIGKHAGDERFGKPEHEGIAVLQNFAAIRRDAVGTSRFRGGADGEGEIFGRVHGKGKADLRWKAGFWKPIYGGRDQPCRSV